MTRPSRPYSLVHRAADLSGLTLTQLAVALGLAPSTVQNYALGLRTVPVCVRLVLEQLTWERPRWPANVSARVANVATVANRD